MFLEVMRCTAKEARNEEKKQPTEWEQIFYDSLARDSCPKYIKNSYNSIIKGQMIPLIMCKMYELICHERRYEIDNG